MNEKAVLEIGELLRVTRKFDLQRLWFRRLTAEEILNTHEYKEFKETYPEICKLIEEA